MHWAVTSLNQYESNLAHYQICFTEAPGITEKHWFRLCAGKGQRSQWWL